MIFRLLATAKPRAQPHFVILLPCTQSFTRMIFFDCLEHLDMTILLLRRWSYGFKQCSGQAVVKFIKSFSNLLRFFVQCTDSSFVAFTDMTLFDSITKAKYLLHNDVTFHQRGQSLYYIFNRSYLLRNSLYYLINSIYYRLLSYKNIVICCL